ncbi:DUF4136 domain-containing protein [Pontibacter sp. MBLB2868]|uniref:DUF4136 domain-containing protein n=1 Tax=Pontibacter sp. MBLB2868 TaxID=3451555 RepID=UPI003F74EF71
MPSNRLLYLFSSLVMPFLMCSCVVTSGIKATSAIAAPGANLKLYRTYNWYQDSPAAPAEYDKGYGSGLDEKIREALEKELAQKGLTKVSENPDVLVAYDVSVSVPLEKDNPENFATGFGYSYGYMHGYRYDYGNAGLPGYRAVDLFKAGTLIVDLINPKRNELVWRGWTEGAIENFDAGYKKVQQEVAEVMNKL